MRPIDPGAWVAHTAAVRGLEIPQPPPSITGYGGAAGPRAGASLTTLTSSSPSLASTVQERSVEPPISLSIQSGMKTICCAMQRPDSGLEVRDRMWLKINIPQAFIGEAGVINRLQSLNFVNPAGSEVVAWLHGRVTGFADRREARKYASQMLKVIRAGICLLYRKMHNC